jgi:hypothetical protein
MLPSSVRILVCTEPQDMRRSFDRLAEVVRTQLGEEPQSAHAGVAHCAQPLRPWAAGRHPRPQMAGSSSAGSVS